MIVGIEKSDILSLIEKLAEYQQSTICKHRLMLDLLQLLEQKIGFIDPKLLIAVSSSDDENIILRLETLKK